MSRSFCICSKHPACSRLALDRVTPAWDSPHDWLFVAASGMFIFLPLTTSAGGSHIHVAGAVEGERAKRREASQSRQAHAAARQLAD